MLLRHVARFHPHADLPIARCPASLPGGHACLIIEHKLCTELGLVHGCPCRIVQLVLRPRERTVDPDPNLLPHALVQAPLGAILEEPGKTRLKDATLGRACFYVPCVQRAWHFKFSSSLLGEGLLYTQPSAKVCCRQLPFTDIA